MKSYYVSENKIKPNNKYKQKSNSAISRTLNQIINKENNSNFRSHLMTSLEEKEMLELEECCFRPRINKPKKRKNSLSYKNIILTDEKGNIIEQKEINDKKEKLINLEDKLSLTSNDNNMNNSFNENKKLNDEEDDLEERLISLEEITNKTEKKVDIIKEEDEEYESDIKNLKQKKNNINNLNENLSNNMNKFINKNQKIEPKLLIEKKEFEIKGNNNNNKNLNNKKNKSDNNIYKHNSNDLKINNIDMNNKNNEDNK